MSPADAEMVTAKLDALAAVLGELKEDIRSLRSELGALTIRVAEEYLTKADYEVDQNKFEARNDIEHQRLGGLPAWATLVITILSSLVTGLLVYAAR